MAIQHFVSDNSARVHPKVMEAIAAADVIDAPYDGDALSGRIDAAFSDLFETRCTAHWLSTGTAANALALATYVRPWHGVLCHEEAHVEVDECGAPAMFSGGAKLLLLPGESAKITPQAIRDRCAAIRPDVHQVQPAAVSITNATEYGVAWRTDEVAAVGDACRTLGLKLHMDGARFANAAAFTGATPADLTWRAGVDALSFGFVKNGGMNAEALVFFGDAPAGVRELKKRSGHMMSKGRFAAAQLLAMLDGDLWLANGRAANAGAAAIASAAGDRLMHPVEANELFVRMTPDEAASLRAQGFDFYDWGTVTDGMGAARLVTSWDQDAAAVAPLADALRAL